jgi:hypothetical protein
MMKEIPEGILRWQSPHNSRGDAIITAYPTGDVIPEAAAIVEGPLDALAAAETGLFGVALMGVSPPQAAMDLVIKMTKGLDIFLVWDEDQPEPWYEILKRFWGEKQTAVLRQTYPYKDLAEMPSYERQDVFA